MRFGAFVPQGWRLDLTGIDQDDHWEAMTRVARRIEENGFESLWVYDHFHTVPTPTQEATYEAWTLMASLAAVTDTVRLGQMCTCNTYRQPSYLAKVAGTTGCPPAERGDRPTSGRPRGGNWRRVPGKPPSTSPTLGRSPLRKGGQRVVPLRGEGKHYQLKGAICRPKPNQSPHIPLWVAGGGEQLTLRVAARHAQYTNFGIKPDLFTHKSTVLADHCREVGRDFDEITRSANFNIVCAETEAGVEEKIAWVESRMREHVSEVKAAEQAKLYRYASGTPDQVIAYLRDWEALGLGYAIVYFPDPAYDMSSLDLFAREVIPALAG